MKEDFSPYPVGMVHNPLTASSPCALVHQRVTVSYPSRLSAMSLDSSRITRHEDLRFPAGEIVIKAKLQWTVTVTAIEPLDEIEILDGFTRPSLLKHAVGLMRQALRVRDGLCIQCRPPLEVAHVGLGSSAAAIAAAASAINELYGRPLPPADLTQYLAQNHGEETSDADRLKPVQCIGGAPASGQFEGGVLVLAGPARVIASAAIPDRYHIVIAVPRDLQDRAASELMDMEIRNFGGFRKTAKHAPEVAYRLVHEALPALQVGDLEPLGRIIWDHRFAWGSVENCSFSHPRLLQIADVVKNLRSATTPVVGLSSAGPAFYAVTMDPSSFEDGIRGLALETRILEPFNGTYSATYGL